MQKYDPQLNMKFFKLDSVPTSLDFFSTHDF